MKYDNYCLICDKTVTSSRALSYHLRMTHNMSRKEYVVLTEYGGKSPKCDNPNCDNEKHFEFSKFGKYCSCKCRANSKEHLEKSISTIQKCQDKISEEKRKYNGMSKFEHMLWVNGNLEKLGFLPQRIINLNKSNIFLRKTGEWVVVDFLHKQKNIIIEVDGWSHDRIKEKDFNRDSLLIELGYTVIRYRNQQISDNINFIINDINEHLKR